MRRVTFVAIALFIAGCSAPQQEKARTVAAFEVPLVSAADRDKFLSVLRVAAETEGMHVDAESGKDLESEARVSPSFRKTFNAAVWRGSSNDEVVALATDRFDHLGQVWLIFVRGKDPAIAAKFQVLAMHEIKLNWPSTLSLPIMPNGSIPMRGDLLSTPGGYIVKPSEAHKYQLTESERLSQQ